MSNLYPDELLEDINWSFTGGQFSSLKKFNRAVRKYEENNDYWHPEITILNIPQVKIILRVGCIDENDIDDILDGIGLEEEDVLEDLLEVVLLADNDESFTAGELLLKMHNAFVADERASLADVNLIGSLRLDSNSENVLPTYFLVSYSVLRDASLEDENNSYGHDLHELKSKINCPNCNSDKWKLAAMIYQDGLTHVNTSSNSVGIGVSSSIGVGVGYSDTVGQHQTELSRLAAPPERQYLSMASQGLGYIAFIISCPLFYFFSETGIFGAVFKALLLSGVVIGIGVFMGIDNQDNKRIEEKYKKEKENWEKKKVCMRCGTFY